jgi:hypothetical protein
MRGTIPQGHIISTPAAPYSPPVPLPNASCSQCRMLDHSTLRQGFLNNSDVKEHTSLNPVDSHGRQTCCWPDRSLDTTCARRLRSGGAASRNDSDKVGASRCEHSRSECLFDLAQLLLQSLDLPVFQHHLALAPLQQGPVLQGRSLMAVNRI